MDQREQAEQAEPEECEDNACAGCAWCDRMTCGACGDRTDTAEPHVCEYAGPKVPRFTDEEVWALERSPFVTFIG